MIRKHLITHKNKDLEVQKITQQNKMKYEKNLKNIKHTLGTKEKITKTIHKKKHKKHNKNKKHLNLQSNKNYIANLINLYYDNDNVVNNFLEYKDIKQHIFPKHNRVIVIGDIHGDLDVVIKCLIIAKCINNIEVPETKDVLSMDAFFKTLKWIGNDTYIVQLGDQIDRVRPQNWDNNEVTQDSAYKDEGSTLEIFYLFYYLDIIARKHNGRVFSIIGNHEIMNVEGDFRYVSLKEFKSFKEHLESIYNKKSKFPYHSRTLKLNSIKLLKNNIESNTDSKLPKGYRERLYAFSPTGLCSNLIGFNSYTMLQIGNWLFCHGSPVLNTLNTYPINIINNYVSLYLIGIENNDSKFDNDNDESDNHKSDNHKINGYNYNNIPMNYYKITKHGDSSVLWNRDFGETEITNNTELKLTKQLNTILDTYNNKNKFLQKQNNVEPAHYIAVGHTIQDINKNGINSICNGRVWRCDVAMSKAFGDNKVSKHRKPQVLEILNGNITNVLM